MIQVCLVGILESCHLRSCSCFLHATRKLTSNLQGAVEFDVIRKSRGIDLVKVVTNPTCGRRKDIRLSLRILSACFENSVDVHVANKNLRRCCFHHTQPNRTDTMSWFSAITDTVASVSAKVSEAIPIDRELLNKLTLNTDEMKATREQFGEEAARKAAAKNLLAKMLPWETKDKERDILVDECKEAILALSTNEATFYGPFQMPELDVNVEADDEIKKKRSTDDSDDEEDEEEEAVVEEEDEEEKRKRLLPSEESLEKLAQLEPLPPLLQDFDLECHVGLIQMILKEDPKLVEMQSNISGRCPMHYCHFGSIVCESSNFLLLRRRQERRNFLEKLLFSLCIHTL